MAVNVVQDRLSIGKKRQQEHPEYAYNKTLNTRKENLQQMMTSSIA